MNLRFRILLPFVSCLIAYAAITIVAIYWLQQALVEEKVNNDILGFQKTLAHNIEHEAKTMKILVQSLVENRSSIDINELHNIWLKQDREALLALTKPLFEQLLSTYGITHYYFTLPNRINFLRVHKPDKYGDKIERFITLEAERTGKDAYGIELGLLGTYTLRYVLPWYWQGKLIAYIEIGKELDETLAHLHEMFDIDMVATIKKKYIQQQQWEEGRSLPGHMLNTHWDQFDSVVILNNSIQIKPDLLKSLFSQNGIFHGEYITYNDTLYYGKGTSLDEASGRHVGTLIFFRNVSKIYSDSLTITLWILLITLLTGSALSLFFHIHLGRVERQIEQGQQALIARKAAEETLHIKNDFLANMSHELRTPLNAIIGFSELLYIGNSGKLNEVQQGFAQDIFESGNKLLSIINQILELSKLESGELMVEPNEIYLSDLSQSLINEFSENASEHHIQLTADIENKSIHVDINKLRTALSLLLSNAIKFTNEDGQIKLSMACINKPPQALNLNHSASLWLKASVSDTGIGIAQDDIPKLFIAFKQLENSMTKQYSGIGLGLINVKRIAELLGGTVTVESELGQGSTFTIYAPIEETKG